MSRLIDADALKKAIEVAPYNDIDDLTRTEQLIYDAPTVDDLTVAIAGRTNGKTQAVLDAVRPKGKWIIDGHHRRCKKCGEYFCIDDSEGNEIPSNFCPNCGADMRGDV